MDFAQIVQTHRLRYPLMQPQDYAKLAYQSEFGPAHLLANEQTAADSILQEWQAVSVRAVPCNPEPIGHGFCRFHLQAGLFSANAASALAKLFFLAAGELTGTPEGLDARLEILRRLPVDGMEAWLAAYRRQGCPAVHHSEVFRSAYHPHYRVLLCSSISQNFPFAAMKTPNGC